MIRAALVEVIHAGGGRRFQFAPETPASDFVALAILDEFFYREAELPEADPDRVMADVKGGLPLLERGVGMFFNMGVALGRVELAPGTSTGFGCQGVGFDRRQKAANHAPPQCKPPPPPSTLEPPA